MNSVQRVNHNDVTIIKHAEIYEYYKELCKQNKAQYPELSDYIARAYYYNILSKVFNLTPNYVCSIICKIMNDERKFSNNLLRAKLNLEYIEVYYK